MQRRQRRVIVLDTSSTSRKILEVILRREGHHVICFGDPLEALRFLSRHGPADLLFLSLELPGMDGLSVLKFLKSETSLRATVPIALLEEDDGILPRILARLAGAERVVTKPLVRRQILALVAESRCRGALAQAAEQRTGSLNSGDDEGASNSGRE